MIHRFVVAGVTLALMVGCGGLKEPDQNTGAVASALNTDPGATSLSFHSAAAGVDAEIRSVTPTGQADPIYLNYDTIKGESQTGKSHAIFVGDIVGGDTLHTSAAMAPLAAVVAGLATVDDFTRVTGLTLKPVQLQPQPPPGDPPQESLSLNFTKLALTYVQQKDGDDAAALANEWLAALTCSECPHPKGL